MIATISGIITSITEQCLVVEQSGIGYELSIAAAGSFNLEQQVTLQTYLHWNQEAGPSLYGFQSALEKTTFLLIISCSGIGPKIALTVLNQMDPAVFLQAILEENIKTLSSISGIGAKKAEQMIVALKHKVAKLLKDQPNLTESSKSLGAWKDLIDTLTSLSYSPAEIKSAMNFLKENSLDSATPLSQLLRKALAFLAKK
ncbi:Holliday junction branch migration protein RuvA [Candidatus Chromulinivorax destructor]|uniref:Holliday junction branch migration complex subunit RuvA n=1 Tax=Candidatus Chromulinivorax destructor TaxID=2066483 RepID=A0A345ZBZ6_9BACT|nr:Holliday junction branch migration protein RuvA [Candidatus Chromulinivorax destructor]AXK60813.1 Holliday junction branch migration protein RuvA [Candidatus Chromulinivorax destructor]